MTQTQADDKYDGHSPQTCNWTRCGASVGTPCPFTKDSVNSTPPPAGCVHEWRQLVGKQGAFYCIFCRKIESNG